MESWIVGTTVVVPSDAIEIPDLAFKDNDNITRVMFQPNSTCQRIGNSAFHFCTSLQTVDIPDSVTTIGEEAFYFCTSLQAIDIPDSVTTIESHVFYWCESLETVRIPNSVTQIDESAFSRCCALQTVHIPDSVTTIGDVAFHRCLSLKTVNIPDSVTVIGESTFFYCDSLETVNIPNSVTSIEEEAFGNCRSLKIVNIPDSVKEIESGVFMDCEDLEYVTIPVGSEIEIADDAFDGNFSPTRVDDSMLEVVIPDGKIYYLNNWAMCENLYELLVDQNEELEGVRGTFQLKTREGGTLVDPVKNRINLRRILHNRGLTLHPKKREAETIILPQSKRSKTQTAVLPY